MAFKVELCEPEDLLRCFQIISLAFSHAHAYVEAVFPNHDTPNGQADGAERLLAASKLPQVRLCKAVDTSTGIIAGFAKWDIYDGIVPDVGPKSLQGNYWKDKDEKDYADYIFWEFTRRRWDAVKKSNGHIVSLDIMCFDPAYHRKGFGSLLMEYGVGEADRLGVDAVVEASRMGRYLYEEFGFEILEDVLIQNPPKQAGQQEQFIHWMRRPATKEGTKHRQP
ncbi:hypothetical protein BS50DRAFT_648038 [Corynespora cassiicola Philippines]|uniref:N-acetyltransferase domain-containing protein n=1 Tax=Corynespora cassiicola Philippines TaxID=1448308 RepID=A0A2T2NFC5_CORCC|nr:hypothetical protein BS50DRAFT_648038 [Corynespora cassiicola Philippines]